MPLPRTMASPLAASQTAPSAHRRPDSPSTGNGNSATRPWRTRMCGPEAFRTLPPPTGNPASTRAAVRFVRTWHREHFRPPPVAEVGDDTRHNQ